jgi:hypothetical protein
VAAPGRVLLLDLDECGAGAIWPTLDRPRRPADRALVAQLLSECAQAQVAIHFLTNRPPGQLAVAAQLLGGAARYHLAESGLSAWLPDENRAVVNPAYEGFAAQVRPEVMARLSQALGLSWRGPIVEEFGTRLVTVTIFPLQADQQAMQALAATAQQLLAGLPVEVRVGKGVDIMPAGANKAVGCQWAEQLHPRYQGRQLDWTKVLYVEDSATGLEAAHYVAARGGMVAAVANAEAAFRQAVAAVGGILCEHAREAGVLEALRRWLAQV